MPRLKKKTDRDRQTFTALLSFIGRGNTDAWHRYLLLHERLTRYFERRGCWCAEDLADRTFDRIEELPQSRLLEVPAGKEEGFVINVGKNILKEWWDEAKLEPSVVPEVHLDEAEHLQEDLFDVCKGGLPERERHLLESYYRQISRESDRNLKALREEIAKQQGLSLPALRVRILRIRNKIQACYICCQGCLEKMGN